MLLVSAISPETDAPSRPTRDPVTPWPVAIAAGIHIVLLGAMAILIATPAPLPTPPTVPVEFVTPQEFQALAERSSRVAPSPEAVPLPPAPTPAANDGMTTATTLFAGSILADPANRRIREALPTLERSERIIQLCNLEAFEQLRLAAPDTAPDYVVTYAYGNPTVTGYTLDAPGAAYHEGTSWHHVRLSCTVGPDYAAVTDFRFEIGEVIPPSEWEDHFLMAVEADDDDDP